MHLKDRKENNIHAYEGNSPRVHQRKKEGRGGKQVTCHIALLIVMGLLCMSFASAFVFEYTYNPFTGRLDAHITSNLTGENITATSIFVSLVNASHGNFTTLNASKFRGGEFFGNGSSLNGITSIGCASDFLTSQVLLGNGSCFNLTGRKWITSAEVIDIDKEVIEGDMNVFVDVIGDNMTGPLNSSSNISARNLFPRINNTGSIGLLNRRWNRLFVQKINVSEIGGFSPVTFTTNVNATNFNMSADNFLGLGKFTNVTIETNLTVNGFFSVRDKSNASFGGLNPCLEDGSFCQVNASSVAWNITRNATGPDIVFVNSDDSIIVINGNNTKGIVAIFGEEQKIQVNLSNDSTIVAFYGFEENLTNTVFDRSGRGHALSINGDFNYSLSKGENDTGQLSGQYNGVDTFNERPSNLDNGSMAVSGNFSFGGWFFWTNISGFQTMIDKSDNGNGYRLFKNGGDKVECVINGGGGETGVQFSEGAWNHIWCQRDITSGLIKMYVNGTLDSTNSESGHVEAQVPFTLGARGGLNEFFSGRMDEIILYNRSLTDVGVANLAFTGPNTTFFLQNITIGSGGFFVDQQGRVGIGTETPSSSLEVFGNVEVSGLVSAGAFIDTTPGWNGSDELAYELIDNITTFELNGRTLINHSSLPAFVRSGPGGRDIGALLSLMLPAKRHTTMLHANPPALEDNWNAGSMNVSAGSLKADDWSNVTLNLPQLPGLDNRLAWNITRNATGRDMIFVNTNGSNIIINGNRTDGLFEIIGTAQFLEINLSNDTTIIAFYSYEENTSLVLFDRSGKSHDLSFKGDVEFIQSKMDSNTGKSSGLYDGASTFKLRSPSADNGSMTVSGSFSFGGWFYWNSTAGVQTMIDKQDGAEGYRLYKNSGNKIQCEINDGSGETGMEVSIDTWYHFWCQRNMTDNLIEIYVDGLISSSNSESGYDEAQVPFVIGSQGGENEYFSGRIDEVILYNRSLSHDEVLKLKSNGPNTTYFLFNKTIGKGGIFVAQDGKVGIGRVDPDVALDVFGDLIVSGVITANVFVDATPAWDGTDERAFQILDNITTYEVDGKTLINHSSLPAFARHGVDGRDLGALLSLLLPAKRHSTMLHESPPPLSQDWNAGNVSILADQFIDLTDAFNGSTRDALHTVLNTSYYVDAEGVKKINHSSYDSQLIEKKYYRQLEDCGIRDGKYQCDVVYTLIEGRSIGTTVTTTLDAMKELTLMVQALEERIVVLESR